MSSRRIVTAREQYEMLSPWRLASTPGKIYRGIRLTNLPDELRSEIHRLQQPPMEAHEVGQHLKIGPMLLDHLHNTPWKPFTQTPDHLAYTGLGRHWSRRKEFAQMAASNQIGPGMSVVIEADDPGEQHYDPDLPMTGKRPDGTGWEDEQEATLLPNTPLNITSVRLPGKLFDEVLDDPYYHNMEQEYGHPYPGGPRAGVGGVALDPFAKNRQARVAGFDPMKVTNRLKGEFHDWFHSLPEHRLDELRNIEMHPFMDHHEDNPVSHWPTVERFLKDKYPAAHRGFMTGHEDASMWLDDPDNEYESPMLEGDDEFGSLPPPEPYSSADHEKLGYDPQEVAAGMVLLHNRAHSGRQDSYLNTDKKRLVDIFNKRQQMQRNYEQRTGATYWHITDHPDFKPDPNFRPENNSTLGGHFNPGLFVSQHPEHWMQSYGYYRPYLSEIDVPDEVGRDFDNSERFITPDQYDKIKVERTIPIDAYGREQYGQSGWVESNYGEDFETGEKFTDYQPMSRDLYKKTPGYKYPGTAMDQPEEWRKNYERKVRDYQQRTPGIIAGVRLGADNWDHPAKSEGFDAWRNRLWDGVMNGKTFSPNAPGSHYRAMSDKEYQAGMRSGVFRPLIGDHLYVTDDPDRVAGGAYGARGGGHIVEFTPQPTHDIPSATIGNQLMEKGVTHIPLDAVRRVWSWNGTDHMPEVHRG